MKHSWFSLCSHRSGSGSGRPGSTRRRIGAVTAFIVSATIALGVPESADAQCRTATTAGGATAPTIAAGGVSSGSVANTGAQDNVWYQISSVLGLQPPTPVVRTMFSTMVENGSGTGPIFYGAVVANPTAASITVTQVLFTSTGDLFANGPANLTPAATWTRVDNRNVRWTGSVSVPGNGAVQFLFSSNDIASAAGVTYSLTTTATTPTGTYTATPFSISLPGSQLPYASDAIVGFDLTGAGTYAPTLLVDSGTGPNTVVNLPIRVRETNTGGAAQNNIATALNLTVTVPAGWSNVSVPTIAAPWSAGTLAITQPTATTAGQVSITTNAAITRNTSTAANSLVLRATSPAGVYLTSLFPFTFQLNGKSSDTSGNPAPITSKNESVVRIVQASAAGSNVEFLTPALQAPVRQIDLTAAANVTYGLGSETVSFDVYDFTSSSWTNVGSATPGGVDAVFTRSFTSDFSRYVDGANRMRVRVVSAGATTRIIGVDFLRWVVTTGYTVNNLSGSDLNPGNVARPFASIATAVATVGAQGAIYVDAGSSRAGTPYTGNVIISGAAKAGVLGCPTLLQGVAAAGLLPLVVATGATDVGLEASTGANFVTIDGFELSGGQVQLAVDTAQNVTLSDNIVNTGDGAYGVFTTSAPSVTVLGNTVRRAAGATFPYEGIWVYQSNAALVDGNIVTDFSDTGIIVDGSSPATVQRNVSARNVLGIDILGGATNVNVYNNTLDQNTRAGLHANGLAGAVTVRNTIFSRNGYGFSRGDASGTVTSNYDDFFSNTGGNYQESASFPVAAGANDTTNDPKYVNPGVNWSLQAGSLCIAAGTNVGLPYNPPNPNQGAY
jgi:hypothetical protein